MTATDLQTVFAGLLVFITAVYAWTTRRQLTAMTKALEETRRSNTATEKSNEIAERSLELARRAWLILEINGAPDMERPVKIIIRNVGGVPATNVTLWTKSDYCETPTLPETMSLDKETVKSELTIAPHGSVTTAETLPALSEEQIGRVKNGQALFYFYCDISYRDIFDRPRRTTLCTRLGVDPAQLWTMALVTVPGKHSRLE